MHFAPLFATAVSAYIRAPKVSSAVVATIITKAEHILVNGDSTTVESQQSDDW
jgi:hypothetical protein